MTFWDTATGFAVMRRQMEQEQNKTFSHADYANALSAVGLKADKNNAALYAFTATHYQGLSPEHRMDVPRCEPCRSR